MEMEQPRSLVEEFDSLIEDDRDTRKASQLDPLQLQLQLVEEVTTSLQALLRNSEQVPRRCPRVQFLIS